jgi:hypothetical protein
VFIGGSVIISGCTTSGDLPYRYEVEVQGKFAPGEDEALWSRLRLNMALYVRYAITVMPQPPCDYHGRPVPWCDMTGLRLEKVRLLGGENFWLFFHLPYGYPNIDIWPYADFEGSRIVEIGWTP